MKRAITVRIIVVSLVSLFLSSLVFGLILRENYQRQLEEETYNMLSVAALLEKYEEDKDAFAARLSEQYEGYRITVIAKDGTVLGDSHADPEALDNHAGRAEIKDALKFGKGSSLRHSDTIGILMMYVAYRTENGTILRASLPLANVRDSFGKQIPAMCVGILVAVIAAVILAGQLTKTALLPLRRLSEGMRRVEKGDYTARLSSASYEELSDLAKSVNAMVAGIEKNVRELDAEKQKLSFLIDSMRQGLIVVDQEQNIVHVNRSAEMLFHAGQDLTGKPLLFLTQDMRILGTLSACLKSSGSAIFEIHNEASGQIYSVSINPLSNEWLKNGAIIILTDVTQNVQTEQIRREFVANASHELKTPITAIKGFAEILSAGIVTDPEKTKDYLERIKNESERMTNIIEDFLRLSQLDEGKEIHPKENVELLHIVKEAVRDFQPAAENKQITIRVSGEGFPILAEQSDMRLLITNLVDNAIKYNVQGGTVEISVEKREVGGLLRVKDSGIGIPEKDIPRVFERFYRVDKGRSRKVSGTGLGLSIVKHIAAKYKAEIELKSRSGAGSEFVIRFP